MEQPDDATRRAEQDDTAGRPRLTPRPDGGGETDEPMADIVERGDRDRASEDRTADSSAEDGGVPLTESQRVTRESLADPIPTLSAEQPEGDGQKTPPIAP